ncbi:MAG: LytTR family DNA-binding domain-containing protein [Bacteroidales bacterium]|nr:LytTR family DNA-binding domain-containing protein [Bacteroidales bacterium]MDE6146676.1 LytTR family DNA-binding domain-containing protein [Bacteroidales bacterium]
MNVLIVEDEIMAQKSLARLLTRHFPDISIAGCTDSVRSTVAWLKEEGNSADIIFMDVELSDGECFEIFRHTDVKAKVIMTTAYDSYAIKAFETGSVDYLLKPIDPVALKRAVARCRMSGGQVNVESLMKAVGSEKPHKDYKERYIVRFNDRIIPLAISNIAYVYSEEKNNYIVTFDEQRYIIDSSLDVITEELNPKEFFRISRSCIISMKAITSIIKQAGGRLRIMPSPASYFEMTVSRSRVDDFLLWLEK